jgi:hypothetical protein
LFWDIEVLNVLLLPAQLSRWPLGRFEVIFLREALDTGVSLLNTELQFAEDELGFR